MRNCAPISIVFVENCTFSYKKERKKKTKRMGCGEGKLCTRDFLITGCFFMQISFGFDAFDSQYSTLRQSSGTTKQVEENSSDIKVPKV